MAAVCAVALFLPHQEANLLPVDIHDWEVDGAAPAKLVIRIDSSGSFYLNGVAADLSALSDRLSQLNLDTFEVVIAASPEAPSGALLEVTEQLVAAGAQYVLLEEPR